MTVPLSEAGLTRLGGTLATSLPPGSVVWLEGDLGAGKTTLARALATGRGARQSATSPTFSLVHRYETSRGPVYHVDCYRLRAPDEASELDWATMVEGDLLLIEWPERAGVWAPPPDLRVRLDYAEGGEARIATLDPDPGAGGSVTTELRLAIDSATDRLSVAADAGLASVGVELGVVGTRRHAASLLPLIDQVLARLGGRVDDLGLVAVSDGPGSFTGLRVGIAVAKALALSAGIPLVSTPSLLVRSAGKARPGERVLALSSALRGEVFAGAWQFDHAGGVVELFSPRAIGRPHLDALPPVDRIVGDGPADLIADLCARAGLDPVSVAEGWPSAVVLLRLAGMSGGTRVITAPATWEPTYGRPAEAQAKWELEHGRPLPDPSLGTG